MHHRHDDHDGGDGAREEERQQQQGRNPLPGLQRHSKCRANSGGSPPTNASCYLLNGGTAVERVLDVAGSERPGGRGSRTGGTSIYSQARNRPVAESAGPPWRFSRPHANAPLPGNPTRPGRGRAGRKGAPDASVTGASRRGAQPNWQFRDSRVPGMPGRR